MKQQIKKHMHVKPIKQTKDIFAFCFNIMLALLEAIAVILLFTVPIEFIRGGKIVLEISTWTTFKWFTTDSNLVMLIGSVIFCIFMCKKWNGKIKQIPYHVHLTKMIMTAMLVLVLVVILGYTAMYPSFKIEMTRKGVYMGSNLLHHVFCPIVSIVTFLLFEESKDIPFKTTFYGLIPVVAYIGFYLAMAYTHQNPDGTFIEGYDWYGFCRFGVGATIPMAIGGVGIYYLFIWLLWFLNKKIAKKLFK